MSDDVIDTLTVRISRANLREQAEEAIEGAYRYTEVEPRLLLDILDQCELLMRNRNEDTPGPHKPNDYGPDVVARAGR